MTTFKPTEEQAVALAHATAGRSLRIEARAGAGKTSTLKLIANAMPKRRMLYTSFGKKNVADFKAAAPRNVTPKTNHGLAWATHGQAFKDAERLGTLTPRALAAEQGWSTRHFAGLDAVTGAYYVLQTISTFCQSADREINETHAPFADDPPVMRAIFSTARRLWDAMSDMSATQKQTVTHDVYLKLWALTNPQLRADVLLLDEAQDSTPLVIDLFARQRGQIIVVGDSHQQIYSWRGAVNAMSAFKLDATATLSQSFRFGPRVADAANIVLQSALDPDITLRGFDALDTRLDTVEAGTVVTRTNMGLIGELAAALKAEQSAVIVGGTADLVRLLDSVNALQDNRKPTAAELTGFRDWDEVVTYAKTPPGKDLAVLVNLVEEYSEPELRKMVNQVPKDPTDRDEENADVILTTAHKSKGREWDHVRLTDDFVGVTVEDIQGPKPKNSRWEPEQSRLLYVAVTRAQKTLDVSGCSAFLAHLDTLRALNPGNPLARPDHPISIALRGDPVGAASAASSLNGAAPAIPAPPASDPTVDRVRNALAHATRAMGEALDAVTHLTRDQLSPEELSELTAAVSTLYRNARSSAEAWRDLRSAVAPLAHGTPSP
ncbi:putative DNA helicase [Dolichospermum phage Dfl-JY45]